jgi:hypothetical protein
MSVNLILPFLSAGIMFIFTAFVLQRYLARRRLYSLFWGIGLAMFGAASLAEAYLAVGWNRWVFFIWYVFGAALNVAWIGQGTLYLLVRKQWPHVLAAVLLITSLIPIYLMLQVMPNLDETLFTTARPISEQYGTKVVEAGEEIPAGAETRVILHKGEEVTVIPGLLPLGAPVRRTTPFFNIYGLITLVGGAIWSSYLFWRKRVMPQRVVANLLIAAGALSIAFTSTLTRLGYGSYLYLGELIAAILMFIGFLMTAAPDKVGERPVEPVSSQVEVGV